jgi:hypothetical protein
MNQTPFSDVMLFARSRECSQARQDPSQKGLLSADRDPVLGQAKRVFRYLPGLSPRSMWIDRCRARNQCLASSGYRESLHPGRSVIRRLFLIEVLPLDSIRVPLKRQRAITQMRQNDISDFSVKCDDLCFRSPGSRKKQLVQIGERYLSTVYQNLVFFRHAHKTSIVQDAL